MSEVFVLSDGRKIETKGAACPVYPHCPPRLW